MTTFVVRVWVPDRPGALGQVASRIGAVRGDVIGIEILERGAGRAVDELLVELPEPELLDLLVAEIAQVDGVDVEDVRLLRTGRHDPGMAALELAAELVDPAAWTTVLERFCQDCRRDFDADWVGVLDLDGADLLAGEGELPPVPWLSAFMVGAQHLGTDSEVADSGPDDLVWAQLPHRGVAIAAGRRGRPFRWKERRQFLLLARVASAVLDLRRDPAI